MTKRTDRLTAERARELFAYDPATGIVTRRVSVNSRARVGDVVGVLWSNKDGLRRYQVTVDYVAYKLHRVIWLMVTGEWPAAVVDHRDGDGTNNAWVNLRDVSQQANSQNQRKPKPSKKTDAPLGVSVVNSPTNPYQAMIGTDGQTEYLGRFSTAEDAHEAYVRAKRVRHDGCTL